MKDKNASIERAQAKKMAKHGKPRSQPVLEIHVVPTGGLQGVQ